MGDGRSGSTLLDSILSNIDNSISVGECHRFWTRFYENESLCGCSDKIGNCTLWSMVDTELKDQFDWYDPSEFEKRVREIQYYRNFKRIPSLLSTDEWLHFSEVVTTFYTAISNISEKKVIIDSSKSVSWAYMLQQLGDFDVRIIHLERNLTSVANSWKKMIRLPEYLDKAVYMPTKSNWLVTKSWIKIKSMALKLKRKGPYFFLRYECFIKNPRQWLEQLMNFIDEQIDSNALKGQPNHAIGGNPIRSSLHKIEIRNEKSDKEHLTIFERIFFNALNGVAKILLS